MLMDHKIRITTNQLLLLFCGPVCHFLNIFLGCLICSLEDTVQGQRSLRQSPGILTGDLMLLNLLRQFLDFCLQLLGFPDLIHQKLEQLRTVQSFQFLICHTVFLSRTRLYIHVCPAS